MGQNIPGRSLTGEMQNVENCNDTRGCYIILHNIIEAYKIESRLTYVDLASCGQRRICVVRKLIQLKRNNNITDTNTQQQFHYSSRVDRYDRNNENSIWHDEMEKNLKQKNYETQNSLEFLRN